MLSLAHAGCDFRCLYCQNCQFAQRGPDETRNIADFDRAQTVAQCRSRGLVGFSFTYTEPATRLEFVANIATAARAVGLLPALCTCGFVKAGPLSELVKPFVPMYKLTNLPSTPQVTLEPARQVGLDAGLRYVYISNLAPHEGNYTYCPKCGKIVVLRLGLKVFENHLEHGHCPQCRTPLPELWT